MQTRNENTQGFSLKYWLSIEKLPYQSFDIANIFIENIPHISFFLLRAQKMPSHQSKDFFSFIRKNLVVTNICLKLQYSIYKIQIRLDMGRYPSFWFSGRREEREQT